MKKKRDKNFHKASQIAKRASDYIEYKWTISWDRRKLPASGKSPLACDTGQERRSTGVRPLVSSKVREAPNCKRTPAIHRWPKWSALCRLLQPDSPSCHSGNFSENLHTKPKKVNKQNQASTKLKKILIIKMSLSAWCSVQNNICVFFLIVVVAWYSWGCYWDYN